MRTGSLAQSMPLAQDLSRKKPSRPAAMLSEGMTAEGRRWRGKVVRQLLLGGGHPFWALCWAMSSLLHGQRCAVRPPATTLASPAQRLTARGQAELEGDDAEAAAQQGADDQSAQRERAAPAGQLGHLKQRSMCMDGQGSATAEGSFGAAAAGHTAAWGGRGGSLGRH